MPTYLLAVKEPIRYSETFITQLLHHLGDNAGLMAGYPPHPQYMGAVQRPGAIQQLFRRLTWITGRRTGHRPVRAFYKQELRRIRPEVVIAQFGPSATLVMDACRDLHIPLVTIFHGYDVSQKDVVEEHASAYQQLFSEGAAFVGVSRSIRENLLALGAPSERTFVSPCGADCSLFTPDGDANQQGGFLAVGRFTEKKAPHLTLLAFSEVLDNFPDARLRMIGEGSLLNACKTLVTALKIGEHVSFLGSLPHEGVRDELDRALAFVQHSVTATDGDQEGSPVSIMEAGAAGVPVIATRHSGIPGIVQHGKTGLLVEEHDIQGMANAMKRLLTNPSEAGEMGQAAAKRIHSRFQAEELSYRVKEIADWARDAGTPKPDLIPTWLSHATGAVTSGNLSRPRTAFSKSQSSRERV